MCVCVCVCLCVCVRERERTRNGVYRKIDNCINNKQEGGGALTTSYTCVIELKVL